MSKAPNVLSTRRQNGRLSTVEREEALDRLARIVFAEGKTPSHRELAESLGLSRSAIPNLLERLYATAERERPTIGRMRETLVRRLEAQFARTLDVYTSARAQGDNRAAVEALRAGTDVLTRAGKLTGVEDARINRRRRREQSPLRLRSRVGGRQRAPASRDRRCGSNRWRISRTRGNGASTTGRNEFGSWWRAAAGGRT